MTTAERSTTTTWATERATVGGGEILYDRAGNGPPVLVLPRDNGHPPGNDFLDRLAQEYTVYYPWYPGFHGGGDPAAWEWIVTARDLAVLQLQLLDALGLARVSVVGLGFGGWLAAEMAAMAGDRISALLLVGAMGIKPSQGFIYDQFIVSCEAYAREAFADQAVFDALYTAEPGFDQLESWETDREMTSRIAWKPYMHNRALPDLLRAVRTPALVVWGANDTVVPVVCAEQFRAVLPNAQLEVLAETGHAVDLEQPRALASIASSFLKSAHVS